MSNQKRSISEQENYATYLGLPLVGLSKFSFGEDNFINSFFTENGKILVSVVNNDHAGPYWKHFNYLTDIEIMLGTGILYNCPKVFEPDMSLLLNSQYSKISEQAKEQIYLLSGLTVDFPHSSKKLMSSPLVHSLRHIGEGEKELPLREQDIVSNIDSELTFQAYDRKSEDTSLPH